VKGQGKHQKKGGAEHFQNPIHLSANVGPKSKREEEKKAEVAQF